MKDTKYTLDLKKKHTHTHTNGNISICEKELNALLIEKKANISIC